jgi:putative PEP-CTERM system TPR-repeat lipoprotein
MNRKLIGNSRKRVLALSLGLTLTGCNFFQETTDIEHVARAKAFLDKNDYRSGSIELKSALQKNPDNAEARRLLGKINLTLGNGDAAEKEFRKAIELGVAREAILVSLAEALQLQGKNKQILDEIDAPQSLDASDRARLISFRGDGWLAETKLDKARTEYEHALAIDDRSASAKLGLARVAFANKELDRAEQLVAEAIDSEPDLAKLWSFRAELEKAKGEAEKAEVSYGRAIELRHINYADRANRALLRVQLNKLDGAKEDVEQIKKNAPNYFMGHYADGIVKLAEKKYPEAQAAFDESLRLNDRFGLTFYFLAASHFYQNHLEQADAALARFLAEFPGSVKGHQVMALVKFREKDFAAAKKFLVPVMRSMPTDVPTLKLMAAVEFALCQSDEGIEYLQKVTELEPDSPITKVQLGLGMLQAGEAEKGLEALEAAIDLDPDLVQAKAYIALTHIRAKQFDKAQSVIDKLKTETQNEALPLNLEAMMYVQKNDLDSARKHFEDVLKIDPKNLTALNNLAQLAFRERRFDRATELFQAILKDHPKHIPAFIALAQIQGLSGKAAETEAYLTQATEADPNALLPRVLLARLYSRFGQAFKAIAQLEEVRNSYGKNPEFLATLAEAQLEGGNYVQALETAKALVAAAPKSGMSYYLLARVQAENGDVRNVRTALQKSLELDPKLLQSRLAMVRLLAQEQKLADAAKYLADLKKELPENPEVMGLEGMLALQQRKPQNAVNVYKSALEKFPSSGLVISLAQAQSAAGDADGALKTLRDWIQRYPRDIAVRYLTAGLYVSKGREEDAKAELKAILGVNPNHVPTLNDLAWLLRKENPEQALDYAEKASSLAKKSAPVMDTLAMVVIEKGQFDRALNILKDAHRIEPDNRSIRYHLAIAQEKSGLVSEARATLSELLQEHVAFDERNEAELLFKKLTRSKSGERQM